MLEQIAPGIIFVSGKQNGKFPYSNSLLLRGTKATVLVDTGAGESILKQIAKCYQIDIVINTHFHIDHIHGNKFFPNAELWAHVHDIPALESEKEFKLFCGFEDVEEKTINAYFSQLSKDLQRRPVSRGLLDGDTLDLGDSVWKIVHTPGHTPGHIALYEVNRKILFSSDIDLSSFGPWYGNTCSELQKINESIDRLQRLEIEMLISSHKEPIKNGIKERLKNYKEIIVKREQRILQSLEEGKTQTQCLEEHLIQRNTFAPEEIYLTFERNMLKKHLEKLWQEGKIVKKGFKYYKK